MTKTGVNFSLRGLFVKSAVIGAVVLTFGVLPAAADSDDAPGCAFGNNQKNGQTATAPGCEKAKQVPEAPLALLLPAAAGLALAIRGVSAKRGAKRPAS